MVIFTHNLAVTDIELQLLSHLNTSFSAFSDYNNIEGLFKHMQYLSGVLFILPQEAMREKIYTPLSVESAVDARYTL